MIYQPKLQNWQTGLVGKLINEEYDEEVSFDLVINYVPKIGIYL